MTYVNKIQYACTTGSTSKIAKNTQTGSNPISGKENIGVFSQTKQNYKKMQYVQKRENMQSYVGPIFKNILAVFTLCVMSLYIAHFIKPYRDQVHFFNWISVRFYETGWSTCTLRGADTFFEKIIVEKEN